MRVSFEGLDKAVDLRSGCPVVLTIENKALFTRICRSLHSGEGESAEEPYSVWSDGKRISPSSAFVEVPDPLNLPWDHKDLVSALYAKIETLAKEDEETRFGIERLGEELACAIERLTFQIDGNYGFAVQWSLRQHLKAFKFSADRYKGFPYLDSLIAFLDFYADMGLSRSLVISNLERFLDDESLDLVFERAFFNGLKMLVLENVYNGYHHCHEVKMLIDQDFLEDPFPFQSESPSSVQGGICSNGFGAVTF